jgi:hypothetical protein
MDEGDADRDSSIGIEFSVSVELKRRRGRINDKWEARLTAGVIALVTSLIVLIALVSVFQILRSLL